MKDNNHRLLNLTEIFENRRFKIPDYQRGYSWENEQRQDLLDDLDQISIGSYSHFTGTIVAALANSESNVYEIVDGQQRLTTISLLLKAIIEKREKRSTKIKNNFLFYGEEFGNTKHKLTLNEDLDTFYKELITKGKLETEQANTKSKRNIQEGLEQFRVWAKGKDEDQLDTYVNKITTSLGFIFYTPTNNKEIGIMFEVINNRGKKLSELEKVKNYFVYLATKFELGDFKKTIMTCWGKILTNLSTIGWHTNLLEDAFLRNCWIVFESPEKRQSRLVYSKIKENYPTDDAKEKWTRLNDLVLFMVKASDSLRKLYTDDSNDTRIQLSQHPTNASVLPAYLAIDIRLEDTNPEKEICLALLEKLNFRYYVCGVTTRSDAGQSWTFWFANQFYNHFGKSVFIKDRGEEIINIEWILNEMTNFVKYRANDLSFIKALTLDYGESGNYYNWNGLKYFLCNYEMKLAQVKQRTFDIKKALSSRDPKAKNDFYHREHIWAVKEHSILNDSRDLDINKRRLGNYILLKEILNIRVSSKPVGDKISMYEADSKEDLNTRMLLEIPAMWHKAYKSESKHWKRKTKNFHYVVIQSFLDSREEKLINFALQRWKVDGLDRIAEDVTIDSSREGNEVFEIKFNKEVENMIPE